MVVSYVDSSVPSPSFQELLHKIPSRKFSTKKIKPLRHLKYAVLLIAVIILPAAVVNHTGLGDPYFCKYICPQGVLEGAIPLCRNKQQLIPRCFGKPFYMESMHPALQYDHIKCSVLPAFLQMAVPYWEHSTALFENRISLLNMQVDKDTCISCRKCAHVCGMDVDITKTSGHSECIRCGVCIKKSFL